MNHTLKHLNMTRSSSTCSDNSTEFQQTSDMSVKYYRRSTVSQSGIYLILTILSIYACCSPRTISRRWKEMGLLGPRKSELVLPAEKIVQLVASQLETDPSGQLGKNGMKQKIALETGYHLRRYVRAPHLNVTHLKLLLRSGKLSVRYRE
jgi:hypothetical protein